MLLILSFFHNSSEAETIDFVKGEKPNAGHESGYLIAQASLVNEKEM